MYSRTILCIDDDPNLIQALSRLFQREDFQVYSTSLETVTFEMLEFSNPEIILLDLSMPRISGLEILKRLRSMKNYQTIPILVLSGRSDPETMKKVQELGANEFLPKPFDPVALIKSVEKYLPKRKVEYGS